MRSHTASHITSFGADRIRDVLEAYVDESYCEDWFFMAAAVSTDMAQVASLDFAIQGLLREVFEPRGLPHPEEIHGHEIMQGKGPWVAVPLAERLSVMGRVLQELRRHDVRFIIRGLDRVAQRRRYRDVFEPYPMILTHVLRTANAYASEGDQRIRLVCDEIDQHDRHRAMLERHRHQGTPGYQRTTLEQVYGQLTFQSSIKSPMIQAADVVAYLRHRIAAKPAPDRRELRARRSLWRIVEPLIDHDYVWKP